MNKIINNTVIDYTKAILTQSSIYIDEATNNSIDEEDLQDTLLDDESEVGFENRENEDVLLERVWWLSKPRIVARQIPTVSARQVQITRQRLSSTIKKPSNIAECLRGKVEGHLKQQRQTKMNFN